MSNMENPKLSDELRVHFDESMTRHGDAFKSNDEFALNRPSELDDVDRYPEDPGAGVLAPIRPNEPLLPLGVALEIPNSGN